MVHKPDMSEVLRKYNISLNRNKKALCPFHSEKTPSLSIKGKIYNCFGCGVKGDSIDFVMRIEKCNFKEAIRILNIEGQRETKVQKIQNKRRKIKEQKYWQDYKLFAEFDKICVANKPSRNESPNYAWIVANEFRDRYWDKLLMNEVYLWK